jgi:hypothetical protein
VALVGGVHRVDRVEEVLEQLRSFQEEQFSKEPGPDAKSAFAPASFPLASNVYGTPKPLSAEGRENALAAWRSKSAEHIAKGREHFLGAGLPGAGISVISRDRFVAKPHLTVTFHGCELLDYLDPDDADFDKAAEPVIRRQDPLRPSFDPSALRLRGYPVEWANHGEDAEIMLTPKSFRPNVPWTSDQDDYVIVSRDSEADSVEVSWILTEDGNDDVVTGGFRVLTAELMDAADLLRSVFVKEG